MRILKTHAKIPQLKRQIQQLFSLSSLTLPYVAWCLFSFNPFLSASSSKIDLAKDRNTIKAKILESILPEKKDQSDVLRDLEMRLASEKDYQGAILARDERLALEQEIFALETEIQSLQNQPSTPNAQKLVFLPKDAQLTQCELDAATNTLQSLNPSSQASWPLGMISGGYEVYVTYSGSGADLRIEEGFYYLEGKTADTKGGTRETRLGILRVKSSHSSLKISTPSIGDKSSLRIAKVTLVPCNL